MPLRDLIAALEQEAEQRAATIRAEANAAAGATLAAVETRTAAERQEEVRVHQAQLEAGAQRELSEARRAARSRWLVARSELLARVRAAILAELDSALDLPTYREHLLSQLERAWRYIDGAVLVRCTPALEPIIRAQLSGRAETRIAVAADIGHGFCIRADAHEVSSTLEDVLDLKWPQIAIEVMHRIERAS